mmetsp:Transcript_26027/g.75925  ORF Transcript_26027/g.75925 Transcript_26027/m.75925 type:complete len:224 (+) Transcript_26027:551-1222(+)
MGCLSTRTISFQRRTRLAPNAGALGSTLSRPSLPAPRPRRSPHSPRPRDPRWGRSGTPRLAPPSSGKSSETIPRPPRPKCWRRSSPCRGLACLVTCRYGVISTPSMTTTRRLSSLRWRSPRRTHQRSSSLSSKFSASSTPVLMSGSAASDLSWSGTSSTLRRSSWRTERGHKMRESWSPACGSLHGFILPKSMRNLWRESSRRSESGNASRSFKSTDGWASAH